MSPSAAQTCASIAGSIAEYVPTAPESLPTAMPSRARARRVAVPLGLEAQQRELRAEGRRLGEHAVGAAGDGDVDRLARARRQRRDEAARVRRRARRGRA